MRVAAPHPDPLPIKCKNGEGETRPTYYPDTAAAR